MDGYSRNGDNPHCEMGRECRMREMRFARSLTVLLVGLLCVPGFALGDTIKGKVVFVGYVPPPK
jgi:hypothetical protein